MPSNAPLRLTETAFQDSTPIAQLAASNDAMAGFGDLIERVELFEVIVNSFPGGISVFDKDLKMVLCNDQARRLLDYPDELFADGLPTLEDIFRCNAGRGEYGPGDVEQQV